MISKTSLHAIASLVLLVMSSRAADTAIELANKLSAAQQDQSSYLRLKMVTQGTTLQIQIKQRHTAAATEVVYQILWPKERLGESVLLRRIGNQPPSGVLFVPPAIWRKIDMDAPLFGSDLAYADLLENSFAWEKQAIIGTEVVDRVSCWILESKPGRADRSIYAAVRTWVDVRRVVPLRMEKLDAAGQVLRRVESGRIVTDDIGRHVPSTLEVRRPLQGSSTALNGSKLKHDVVFAEAEFTSEGLKHMKAPQ